MASEEIVVKNTLMRTEYALSSKTYEDPLLNKNPSRSDLITANNNYITDYETKFKDSALISIFNNMIKKLIDNNGTSLRVVCVGNLTEVFQTALLKKWDVLIEAPYDDITPNDLYEKFFKKSIGPYFESKGYKVTIAVGSKFSYTLTDGSIVNTKVLQVIIPLT